MDAKSTTVTNPWTASRGRLDTVFLSEADMIDSGVKDIATCMNVMEEVFLHLHNTADSESLALRLNSHQYTAHPAYLGGRFNRSGILWSGFNENSHSLGFPPGLHMYILNDGSTYEPLSIMSGNLLSAYRSGAVAGVGVRYLGKLDATSVTIVGAGPIAKTTLEAILLSRPSVTSLTVFQLDRSDRFAQWAQENFPQLTSVTITHSLKEAVGASEIVSFCTRIPLEIVNSAWISNGTVVTAWGDVEFTSNEISTEQLGEIIAGEAPRRTKSDEIFVFRVTPFPEGDVAWASQIFDNALIRGIGNHLTVWDSPELD